MLTRFTDFKWTLLMFATLLVGCQSTSPLTFTNGCQAGHLSCFKMTNHIANAKVPPLNHQFSYIKLSLNGQVAWIAKGATETWFQPNTDVYYSANGSVFRWRGGRLVGAQVDQLMWREIDSPTIDWQSLSNNPQSYLSFYRTLDQVDGVFSKKTLRHLKRIDMPHRHAFSGNAHHLLWFHEYGAMVGKTRQHTKDDIWFAIDPKQPTEPVYAQQCLSPNMCITWQKWLP